ncbi:unnamed protein product [Musa acuminata subsp. malaccensis]|uniref:(wild Malaysian banana) hypothetical protein n=1 Tax=Musa acuminata subsp. malaccensis TaxID=214687 RepID=A0A804IUF1_MUSAM|nr:unnamed protein product [Musa acuminata subsp. malaccensis]
MENGSSSHRRHNPSPALVSTGCSRFKSYLSLCRPPPAHRQPPSLDAHPQPPAREPSLCGDGETAAQAYWRRARRLEQELRKLDMWLSTEKRLTVCLKNSPAVKAENGRAEMARLADGSYLHEIRRIGRPWGSLVMQVSTPLIEENATTAAEIEQVVCGMASLRRGDLWKCLHESMSMSNLSGHQQGQIKGKKVIMGSEDHFVEAVLLDSMENMEGLALEGLRIQMGTSGGRAGEVAEKKGKAATRKDGMVLVMMIQMRDPKENYEAVGEPMIGFIEAAAVGSRRFDVQGVLVAGMKPSMRAGCDGRGFIWSASLKGCERSSSGCCLQYVRHPNRFLA